MSDEVRLDRKQHINDLRELHRSLSDNVINFSHDVANLLKNKQLDEEQVRLMRHQLDELHIRRIEVEKALQKEIGELEALEYGNEAELFDSKKNGLVRVRHSNRDFFLADLFDYALKDDGASMEAPIFALSTKPDLSIWEWHSKDDTKHIKVTPSVLGRATQHDKDILIYIVSQMTEAMNRGREDIQNRTVRFTVHDFLVVTNRQTGGEGYRRLHEAFERLRGTSITTDIKTGGQRTREGFGIIDRWKIVEKSPVDERMVAVEVTLSQWLYNAVQAFEVLTIHPDYFRLRKPLARRLYEMARKHCGHQTCWVISLDLLLAKSGSKTTIKEFRRAIRNIESEDSLPEYRFVLDRDDKVTFYTRDTKRLVRGLTSNFNKV